MSKSIYVDVCALSRPFDDQGFMRIRLETEAVNLILSKTKEGKFKLLVSSAHELEIRAVDDKLLKKSLMHKIGVWCGSPVAFCEKEGLR